MYGESAAFFQNSGRVYIKKSPLSVDKGDMFSWERATKRNPTSVLLNASSVMNKEIHRKEPKTYNCNG